MTENVQLNSYSSTNRHSRLSHSALPRTDLLGLLHNLPQISTLQYMIGWLLVYLCEMDLIKGFKKGPQDLDATYLVSHMAST